MPEYQRKQLKFVHNGIDWSRALDVIPDGKYFWAHNVRSYRDGEIGSRPGLTPFLNIGNSFSWIHTLARMSANQNLPYLYVVGADNFLFVGQNTAQMTNGAINPVNSLGQQFSGMPLSLVSAVPVGGGTPWTYVGDTARNAKVGYYTGDTIGVTEARFLPIGLPPPIATTVPTASPYGNLTGNYQWIFVQRNKFTGVRSNPSAATRSTLATPALALTAGMAVMTLPATLDSNHVIDVYRFGGVVFTWRLVGQGLTGGASFTDNLPDSSILTALQPSQITDPVTGITRFNLFQPFITQQAATSGTRGGLSQQANGTWRLSSGLGDPRFNLNWLPGSTITIAGVAMQIYQVIDSNNLEVADDASEVGAGTWSWSVPDGTLAAGQPERIWGPWGLGETGAYTFGCGDGTGTLYWTNGNDADSTDIANSLVVTGAGEPLVFGCVFDGRNLLWSTERMFEIFPSLSVAGQFYVQEIPGSRGMWGPYSLTTQTNVQDEVSVSWIARDGPWDYGNAQGLRYLGTDLGTFVPHDNQAAAAVPLSQIGGLALTDFAPPDFTTTSPSGVGAANNIRYQRLCWFEGELFWDFMQTNGNFATLVWSRYANGGNGAWVSVDTIQQNLPVTRAIELSGMNFVAPSSGLMLAVGGSVLYAYTGTNDDGATALLSELITGMQAAEDFRTQKFWGDVTFDLLTAGNQVFWQVMADFPTTGAASGVQLVAGLSPASATNTKRVPVPVTLNSTNGVLARSLGVYVKWSSSVSNGTALYGWEAAYSPKPEVTTGRPLSHTDDGYVGAKYLRAVVIEGNDLGSARLLDVVVDGVVVNAAPLLFSSGGQQQEIPFGFTPKVGYEFQIAIDQADTGAFGWLFSQGFGIRWIWEKWPDAAVIFSPVMNIGTNKPKYFRGFTLPIDTRGLPVQLAASGDVAIPSFPAVTTPSGKKTPLPFVFNPPLVAHVIQLQPNAACAAWWDEIVWDAEEWPELAPEYGPTDDAGSRQAKYIRGFEVPVETGGIGARIGLKDDAGILPNLGAVATLPLIKTVKAFAVQPFVAHELQLFGIDPMRIWFGEVKWDVEIWPELTGEFSNWLNLGTPGVKFIQGGVFPMDTNGLAVSWLVVSDNGNQTIGPFVTPAAEKTPVPFSFNPPLLAHDLQLQPFGAARSWYDEIKWVAEPAPEIATDWQTQETTHDLPGFHSLREAYIAFSDGDLTLNITTEYGTLSYALGTSIPYTRVYLPLAAQKAKWRKYQLVSASGARVYQRDCVVKARGWGETGPYRDFNPFGDLTRENGARI